MPLATRIRCEDSSFLDQAVEDFELGLYSLLMDSVNTPELNAFFHEADALPSLVALQGSYSQLILFLSLLDCSLLTSIKSGKIMVPDYGFTFPVPQAGKMSASMLIYCFSSHPAALGYWASLPPDNVTLNPANKRTDQSPSFRLALVQLVMSHVAQSSLFVSPKLLFRYNYLSTGFWWLQPHTCMNSIDSWLSGQCCVSMGWEYGSCFSISF